MHRMVLFLNLKSVRNMINKFKNQKFKNSKIQKPNMNRKIFETIEINKNIKIK